MRRFGRIAVRVLLWTTVGLAGVLIAVLTALQFKPVRSFARDQGLAAIRGSLKGELYIDDLRWPSLEQIELSGVSLHDRTGAPVLTLPSLIIRLQLHELLRGRVEITHVDLDHPYVDLADFGDQVGLLSVFGSDQPKPPEPKNKASSSFSPIAVKLDDVCIAAGQVALRPDDARNLLLRRLDGCVAIALGKNLTITLAQLRAQLQNHGEEVLEIVPQTELPALVDAAAHGGKSAPMRVGLAGKFSLGDAMAFDGYVRVRQLGRHSLAALGVDGSWLHAPLQLDAHAHTASPSIAYQVDVLASTSNARLVGTWSDEKVLSAKLSSDHFEARHVSDAQLDPARFELDARVDLSSDERVSLQAQLRRARLGALPLPDLDISAARASSGVIDLASLVARQGSALVSARGRLEADGGARVSADVSVPDFVALPAIEKALAGLSGGLSGKVQLQRARSGDIVADVSLALRRLQLQENGAAVVDVQLHASGAPARPSVNAQIRAQQLVVSSEWIATADLAVSGGPDRYELQAHAADHELALKGWLAAEQPGWSGGFELGARFQEERLQASMQHALFVPGASVRVDQLRAEYLGARVFADGQLELGDHPERSKLRFGASIPTLGAITSKFMAREVPGRIEAVGGVHGRVAKPTVEARVRWMNGPEFAKHGSELALYARADLADGKAFATLEASAGKAHAQAQLDSHWRKDQPLSAALKNAHHDLTLDTRGVAIEALASSGGKPAPIGMRGLVSGQLQAHGNPHALQLETHWQADVHAGRDPNALAVALDGSYQDAKFELGLTAHDQQGQLLDFGYSHDLNVEQLLAAGRPLAEIVQQTVWKAHAKFAKRRVRELPLVRGFGLGETVAPLTVATTMELNHQPGAEPTGELKTELLWEPSAATRSLLAPCSQAAHGNATFSAKLANGEVALAVTSQEADKEVARIESGLHARLDDMLIGKTDRIGPTGVTVKLEDFDLAQLPLVCERGKGVLTAQLTGKDLFAAMAEFDMKFEGKALQWYESPALDVRANAKAEGDLLRVRTRIQTGKGELRVDGALPIGFRGHDPLLAINRNGPVALTTKWYKVDVESVLAYVPGIARASGKLDGTIDVSGPLASPVGRGQLQLEDVSFTLPRLGQRFSHLNMKAELDDRNLRLENGKFRDLDGSATIAAQLTLEQADAWSAELNLNVRNFPVRKSGVMMGRAEADIKLVAKTSDTGTDVQVGLKNVAIGLTTSDMGDVQALDRDPEIEFSDALVQHGDDSDKPSDGAAAKPTLPTQITIDSPDPLWVRRDDFAVQMTPKLKIKLGQGPPDMTGTIDLVRGYISLLGTSFDIKRGRVTFTGGERVDPLLEITAEHDANNGDKIEVEVGGFVQAPKLTFSVNGVVVTAGDAIAAINGRSDANGGKGAEQQLASAAIGMTTGLLSLGARREFGDWVPMLSVEQGDQTKVRVGVEADRFIPKFMKGFVRGAYVEGIVATGDANNGNGSSQGAETNTSSGTGVLLELMLPKSFVWAGQYGPGDAWSLDLDWRP